ncbi:MAG: TIGR03936 family radical SAM-associated protein [Lachnospiraceae bacterium]|nr:TIGR03936 family radical SAM-associated protein [Lachnospiraceae bacterium]
MKIRIKFTKTGNMRFIGHLDLMRYFQKLMRRAKVDIRYSEGFSPHQIMSFATAMGLGMTSEGEYVDIDVLSTESSEVMIRRLNAASNGEIQILRYCQIPDDSKSAMSQIAAADYVVSFAGDMPKNPEWLKEKTAEFCAEESIVLLKKTKKSEQEVDIRPMIYVFSEFEDGMSPEDGEYARLFMRLATGSEQNLKPELVMEAFFRFLGLEAPEETALKIHRTEIYGRRDGKTVPLSEYGWDIV